MSDLAHSPQNDQRFDDFLKAVTKMAQDAAAGADSLPNLAVRVVRASNDGVLPEDVIDGKDIYARIYELWTTTSSKKAAHTHTSGGFKANASKLRQLGNFGAITHGHIDPVAVLDKARLLREAMIKEKLKVKPAYAAFVDVARTQLATDVELDEDQLRAVLTPAKTEPDLVKKLTRIRDQLEGLVTGEGKDGLKDQSPQLIAAYEQIDDRLKSI